MPVEARVNYHIKTDARQAFEFDVDGVVGNLISPELVPTDIKVMDLRERSQQPQFETDGIIFSDHPSKVSDLGTSSAWQHSYESELIDLLKQKIGAQEVIVFDHTVRIDDPNAERRPARNVHNDYNQAGAEKRLINIVGETRAQEFHTSGFAFVNVWRPVEHIIQSSPLGFIRPSSMQANDWMNIDLIYPDRIGQILGVAVNPGHEWFYKSRMTPDEVIVFNIYDNRGRPHLAHSALDMPGDSYANVPRKSIESRTLIRFTY